MILALLCAAIPFASDSLRLPPVPREFRGVWVATVGNIDWPSRAGLPVEQQQDELLAILDRAQAVHLNAVILQVRPAGDAFYESQIEPWSEWLTGKQGRAPSPKWDPLAFAVTEAHARGIELHAWFNPFRAKISGPVAELSPLHIARRYPSLAKRYGKLLWMDPGDERVRQHVLRVVLDVVKRYDVDGVHIDDYFYPYPEHERGELVQFADDESYSRYRHAGGSLPRDDWRRENVDKLVKALYDGIHELKPWVKFGISPFGIYRPGFPAGTEGMDTYAELFADARKWLNEGWADYFSPQLYWPLGLQAQNFRALLEWWGGENKFNRHIWPGLGTYKVGTRDWPAIEVVSQIMATRADKTATGDVHYSMHPLLVNQGGIVDQLTTRVYDGPALVPESPWLPGETPRAPRIRFVQDGTDRVQACFGDTTLANPRWWVLYVKRDTAWTARVLPGAVRRMALGALGPRDSVALSAVDRTGRQGGVTVATSAPRC
ncbi:MAG TPA: family 10 glycosylhydrolase [Gemmatimonadaceae bacterium]|nr:family 10 glycosylhydrolase [Gemmatimonadaceae bacterium]